MQAMKSICRRVSATPFQAVRCIRPSPASSKGLCVRAEAARAQAGDFVAVDYTGTLDDGSVFDTSRKEGRTPLEFQIGGGMMIKGFDKAVTGLAQGESRKVRLEPEEAYGAVREDAVITLPPETKMPEGLVEGDKVQLSNGMAAKVTNIGEEGVALDLNHELAGKHLNFDVTLVRLTQAAKLQSATFGAGCFWGPELAFQRVPGVISTEVGYSQGAVNNPSYEDVCGGTTGHAEVVQVSFDPEQVTFTALLEEFWGKHDPTALNRQGNDVGSQYRAGIYTHTPEQAAQAQKFLEAKKEANPGMKIVTELEPIKNYHKAEDYHQQYLARGGRFGRAQNPGKGCNDPIRCYG